MGAEHHAGRAGGRPAAAPRRAERPLDELDRADPRTDRGRLAAIRDLAGAKSPGPRGLAAREGRGQRVDARAGSCARTCSTATSGRCTCACSRSPSSRWSGSSRSRRSSICRTSCSRARRRRACWPEYMCYPTPQYIYWCIPLSVLIGGLVTVGILTRNSELIVMRACGISLYRAALPCSCSPWPPAACSSCSRRTSSPTRTGAPRSCDTSSAAARRAPSTSWTAGGSSGARARSTTTCSSTRSARS